LNRALPSWLVKRFFAIVTHNLQQAKRVADRTGFLYVDTSQGGRTGYLVEFGDTQAIFEDPKGLQHGRVIGDVGVATPDVEAATAFEHARRVAHPSMEQAFKFWIQHKIVGERAVLGAELFRGRLDLVRMPRQGEFLVAGPVRERAQPSSDGNVGAWLKLDVVRRVGVQQLNGRTVQQEVDIFRLGGVAAAAGALTSRKSFCGWQVAGRRLIPNLLEHKTLVRQCWMQ
jgi:hypothetical protein